LRLFADIHPIHFEKFSRLLSKRFPFAVYYEVKGEARLLDWDSVKFAIGRG
jgi:hypothetical protein